MRRLIKNLLYPHGSVRRVLRGPLRGTKFLVGNSMGFTYAYGSSGFGFDYFTDRIKPGGSVYDIGANMGQMTLLFSRLVGIDGKVTSFEPAPEPFRHLKTNVELNNLSNVALHNAGASDSVGTAEFFYDHSHNTQGKFGHVETSYVVDGAKALTVNVLTLDSILEKDDRPPDFLKVDVEGAAGVVFAGATNLLKQHAPVIYIELHGPEEQAAVYRLISEFGYRVEDKQGNTVDDPREEWHTPLFCFKK
jgi:FkbM family methyltransferase